MNDKEQKELFSKLFGMEDDDNSSESSDDKLNDERVMECKRVANNTNNQNNCLGVVAETNNSTEESSEESIDLLSLSSTSEDSIGSNRPPSPFPAPLRGSLITYQTLKKAHKFNPWRLTTKLMVKVSTC
jgi:hypothetical protein